MSTSSTGWWIDNFVGEEVIEERPCYIIEMIPKPDAPVVWGKLLTWIDKSDYLTLKTEFYDEDGYLVNTMYGKNVQEMDGRLIPTILEVIPEEEENQKTVIEYIDIVFDEPIDEKFFSVQSMKRVR